MMNDKSRDYVYGLLLCIAFSLCSCGQDDDAEKIACQSERPLEELPWLRAEVQSILDMGEQGNEFYIEKGQLKGQTVFILNNCCALCNSVIPVLDCEGNVVSDLSGLESQGISLENMRLLWQPENFTCDL